MGPCSLRRGLLLVLTVMVALAPTAQYALAAGQPFNFVYDDARYSVNGGSPYDYHRTVSQRTSAAPASATEIVTATTLVGAAVGLALIPTCGWIALIAAPALGYVIGDLLTESYLCRSVRPHVARAVGTTRDAVVQSGRAVSRYAQNTGSRLQSNVQSTAHSSSQYVQSKADNSMQYVQQKANNSMQYVQTKASNSMQYVQQKGTKLYHDAKELFRGNSAADLRARRNDLYLEFQQACRAPRPDYELMRSLQSQIAAIDRNLAGAGN